MTLKHFLTKFHTYIFFQDSQESHVYDLDMFEDEKMDFEANELLNNLSCIQKTLSPWTTLLPHEQLVYHHPSSTMVSAMVPKKNNWVCLQSLQLRYKLIHFIYITK